MTNAYRVNSNVNVLGEWDNAYRVNGNVCEFGGWNKDDHPDIGNYYKYTGDVIGLVVVVLRELGPYRKVVKPLDSELYFWVENDSLTPISPLELLAETSDD